MFTNFPVFNFDNFTLRRIDLEKDYLDFFKYIIIPDVAKYLADVDVPTSPESAKVELGYWSKLFETKNSFYWAIADKASNKIIGTCGFNYWNRTHQRLEVSYDLDKNYWNLGITTNSVAIITEFAFAVMKVLRIQATVAIDNFSSIKVLEKCGYKCEGLLKNFGILQGVPKDFYMYGITK